MTLTSSAPTIASIRISPRWMAGFLVKMGVIAHVSFGETQVEDRQRVAIAINGLPGVVEQNGRQPGASPLDGDTVRHVPQPHHVASTHGAPSIPGGAGANDQIVADKFHRG